MRVLVEIRGCGETISFDQNTETSSWDRDRFRTPADRLGLSAQKLRDIALLVDAMAAKLEEHGGGA